MDLISAELPRAAEQPEAGAAAGSAVSAFSADLFTAIAGSSTGNLVCSPYSVAVALGMAVQGAKGTTAAQILGVLHSQDAATLAAGLNALDLALSARCGEVPGPDPDTPDRIELASANSLWGERATTWQQPFLEVLGRDFGTGMRVVDYRQAQAARAAINAWVSQQTRTRIRELVPDGMLGPDTVLTMVNALYFKAPWARPFRPELTRPAPFHRLDGSTVEADLMSGRGGQFGGGPGWVAVNLPYAGGSLAMALVVPDAGRYAEVERSLAGDGLSRLLAGFAPTPVRVGLPRWTMRTTAALGGILSGLGMPVAFSNDADFSAMTADRPLRISAAMHEAFIAVDEAGTEAAAATAIMVEVTSMPMEPPRSVVADRPFLYVIHDVPTGVPLFVGRVLDPTAG
jgi:serine protease inhibitor